MLGLGWTEMLVIGVLALIFIGPKDLPVVMNRLGKVLGQVRRLGTDFQREINKTTGLDEVRNLRNSITAPLKKTSDEIRKEFNAMTPTGAKPSGVIKPTDPAAESVVDEIKAKAGMSQPTARLTADETAKAAGFKPAGPAPSASSATFGKPATTAAKKPAAKKAPSNRAPAKAKAAPTSPVVTSELAPIDAPAPVAKKPAAKKTASAPTRKPAATKSAAAKPAAGKAAAIGANSDSTPAVTTSKPARAAPPKPAPKKRLPAKAAPATEADKAGDE